MRQAPGEAVQRLCPHCSTLAYTSDDRCPWCGRGYARRSWPALLAVAVVHALLVLAGVAVLLLAAGRELDLRINREVRTVQRDFDDGVDAIRRDLRRELDRRLPAP